MSNKPKAKKNLEINMPDTKFGIQPNQILFIDDTNVEYGISGDSSPAAKLDISGDIINDEEETQSK